MPFPFIHAKTTNSDIWAFGLKFIDITPGCYLKVHLFAFDKRLVQEQISFKNEYISWFPVFKPIIQHSLYNIDESDTV